MSSIIVEERDGVLVIRLNRPDKYNSFNREMAMAFQQELDRANQDPAIRGVYVTGEGKAFCAGQDLAEVMDPNGPELNSIVRDHYNPIIWKIRNTEKPVVAAVNGVAAGAGANIALACDVCVATESASFIQAFSKIGLIPDSAGTFFLPRIIGFQKASALMMLGDKVSATDAESLGLIYKCFANDQFAEASFAIASNLAKMPTKGLWYTKLALNASYANTLQQQLELEEQLQTKSGNTYDYNEGVNAFLEKRNPIFKGE